MDADHRRTIREYILTSASLGSSSGQTIMVTLLPILLAPHAPSAIWIGAVIAGEGAFAIGVPYIVGALSDRLPDRLSRRFGRRNFFLLITAPVMAAALVWVPFGDDFWTLAGAAFLFFGALNSFLTPLRALVIDIVPRDRWGRVQGVMGALHAGGLGFGLVAGGLLFAIWRPLPFLIAAAMILSTTAITHLATPADPADGTSGPDAEEPETTPTPLRFLRDIFRQPGMRWYLAANALWTAAIDGLRPYLFLFAMAVLGITVAETSLVLIFLLLGVGAGSVTTGYLGDRYGRGRLLLVSAVLTAIALALGVFIRTVPAAIVLLVPAGFGAAALISLPYPVFAELARGDAMGRYTGLFTFSLGIGRLAAPLLVGAAIDAGTSIFPDLDGYPAMWPLAGAFALSSALAFWLAHRRSDVPLL